MQIGFRQFSHTETLIANSAYSGIDFDKLYPQRYYPQPAENKTFWNLFRPSHRENQYAKDEISLRSRKKLTHDQTHFQKKCLMNYLRVPFERYCDVDALLSGINV